MHRHPFVHSFLTLDMNPVVRLLTLSDVILLGSMQLLAPIFALFIIARIPGANAAVVGVSVAMYLVAKSLGQIPAATLLDSIRGENDDYWTLVVSTFVGGLVPLLYLIVRTPLELYGVQFLLGLSAAAAYPSYMAIFTRHIDGGKAATEWGVRFTWTDLGAAIAASLGGMLALTAGFETLVWVVVGVNMLGALLIIPIRRFMKP